MPFQSEKQRERPCAFCQEPVALKIARDIVRKHYCSRACRQKGRYAAGEYDMGALRAKIKNRTGKLPVSCDLCGASFVRTTNRHRICFNCAPNKAWSSRARRYGIGKPQWETLLAAQDGTCALCDRPPTVVDHDHATGATRGLVCNRCNLALHALDVDGWVERAKEYVSSRS